MERTFLNECATYLIEKYGDNISNLHIMLPTRRAITFFKKELTALIGNRAIWQPTFVSVGEVMSQISKIRSVDTIVLLSELYKVYKNYYDESFDKFYYWGSIMLSDFSTIDNYCCDAELLFSNIDDIKEIENRFDYLSEEQKEMILRFWSSVSHSKSGSSSKDEFVTLWNNLYSIYTQFKENLLQRGVGYGGMIYRNGAEILEQNSNIDYLNGKEFAIIGFNALSRSETALFKALKERCNAQFFWDSDNYYTNDTIQEAGFFINQNIKSIAPSCDGVERNNFIKPKEITITSAPSEVLGCKYVMGQIEKLLEKDFKPEECAIVLTNESLLVPLLYSIPAAIENINVTSGYSLNLTSAFTLAESIFRLHLTSNREGRGVYYKELLKLYNHPYIKSVLTKEESDFASDLEEEIKSELMIYIATERCYCTPFTKLLTSVSSDFVALSDNIVELFIEIASKLDPQTSADQLEYINKVIGETNSLKSTIINGEMEISLSLYISLLKKHLNGAKITLEGEPLRGLQVMGILESRNIDFKNLFILSLSEDNYPSMQNINSLIPSNLREGYGLPTSNNHQAMYSYYFYRLMQRAQNIELVYSSYSGESLSGEPSRYLHQLLIESPHKNSIKKRSISLKIAAKEEQQVEIAKDGKVLEKLEQFCLGGRKLSASRLYKYVECPLKFYFDSIEKIKIEEEIADELDSKTSGSIVHSIFEELYKNIETHIKIHIETALAEKSIEERLDQKISSTLKIEPSNFNGRIEVKKRELLHLISNIIDYDIEYSPRFNKSECEVKIEGTFTTPNGRSIPFFGYIDRVDMMAGGVLRIIDYKTGKSHLKCKSLEQIMNPLEKEKCSPIFQTLLYSMFMEKSSGKYVIPALYFARDMKNGDYSPLLEIDKTKIDGYSDVKEQFEKNLGELLDTLFNKEIPFRATDNKDMCKYCDFAKICQKL